MTKIHLGSRLLLSILFLLLVAWQGQLAAAECEDLTATGNSEYPPYLWRNKGSPALFGANRIIIDELATRLGVTINLQDVGSWARAQELAKSGQIDLIAGAFFTIPRVQYMDYVYPAFLETTSVVWKRRDVDLHYGGPRDLISKLGVTVINNSFGEAFDNFARDNLQLEQVASLEQALKMLQHGRVDYVLYEKNPGLAYSELWGFEETIQVLEPPISSEALYLTVSHKSPCNTGFLRGRLAKTVREMIDEGFMEKALQQGIRDWRGLPK